LFAKLQAVFPIMPLAGAKTKFQPVWVGDVARAIVLSLLSQTGAGKTFECVGPQVYSLAQLVKLAGRWAGHERIIISLPHMAGYLQAMLLECLPGQPLMSRDNLASLQVDNVHQSGAIGLEAFGINPRAIETVMPEVLQPHGGPHRFDAWRSKAGRL
jgi:uncharacterized protein YbjT (DUF2867 family)